MNRVVDPMKNIALMRQIQQALSLAKKGSKGAAAAIACATCGKFDKVKPTVRANQEVGLWCGRCRDFSPVDRQAVERSANER